MHFTAKDFKKYIIFALLFIWGTIFAHLFYLYIGSIGEEKPVKWWVLIEWIIKQDKWTIINPIPYLWNNYYSKYVQSILYKWCLNSFLEPELCNVTTNDNKKFIITLTWDNYWTDGRKITLDDVFFTYNDIIFKNSLKLQHPIANNIENIEKLDDKIIVTFNKASVNNKVLFKNYILPKHKLEGKDKDYIATLLWNLVNSTCVWVDLKSDYVNNVILDYTNCDDYYINKYQFILLDNQKYLADLLTWKNKVDLYDAYENIDPNTFTGFKVKLNKRYVLFWNTKKQKNAKVKAYFSEKILDGLKNNLELSKKIDFNWYGLFILPQVNLNKTGLVELLSSEIIKNKKFEFEKQFTTVKNDILNYKEGENKKYFIRNKIEKNLIINWTLLTGWYDKIWISANGRAEYFPKSYNWKTFKYIISEKFKNIKEWENTYSIYAYSWDNRQKLDDIKVFYKKLNYPKFENVIPDFTLVYLDKGLIKTIWDITYNILQKYYPGTVIAKKVNIDEYQDILKSWNYDLVISDINFDWKDISPLFSTNDPISNPSNFANPNFASLINQNLLSPKNLKAKVFQELNKIYQENIPVVFIWNEKIYLFIRKKYNPEKLDYSYFDNRKKFVKSVVINKIKQPVMNKISISWFIDFLKNKLNENNK